VFAPSLGEAAELLDNLLDGDLVLVSGAGDIGGLAARLPRLLRTAATTMRAERRSPGTAPARRAAPRRAARQAHQLARRRTGRAPVSARRPRRPDRFLALLPADEPLLWLGLGSNLLIDDAGWPGTVIQTQGCLTGMDMTGGRAGCAEAGVSCAKAARFATRRGWSASSSWPASPAPSAARWP
jgi:hypothetical protein